jgi:hypothetical protein
VTEPTKKPPLGAPLPAVTAHVGVLTNDPPVIVHALSAVEKPDPLKLTLVPGAPELGVRDRRIVGPGLTVN